jgi:hypothetical protein
MRFSIATHNGTITIRNTRTGNHRTFRIRTQAADARFAPGKRTVSLLTGSNNETDYTGFGFVGDDGGIVVWNARRADGDGIFEKYADMLTRPQAYESSGCEYLWSERCRKCNRPLTDPTSISLGIGPKCRELSR